MNDPKNIEALRRLLTYASREATEMNNKKLSELIKSAIEEIDLYKTQWRDDAIIIQQFKKRELS